MDEELEFYRRMAEKKKTMVAEEAKEETEERDVALERSNAEHLLKVALATYRATLLDTFNVMGFESEDEMTFDGLMEKAMLGLLQSTPTMMAHNALSDLAHALVHIHEEWEAIDGNDHRKTKSRVDRPDR